MTDQNQRALPVAEKYHPCFVCGDTQIAVDGLCQGCDYPKGEQQAELPPLDAFPNASGVPPTYAEEVSWEIECRERQLLQALHERDEANRRAEEAEKQMQEMRGKLEQAWGNLRRIDDFLFMDMRSEAKTFIQEVLAAIPTQPEQTR